MSSAGTLTGRCNDSSTDTTIDLTSYVACHNNNKEPFWAANADPADNNWSYLASGQAKGVETGSTGKSYYLKANCGATDMELPLSRRITNSTASFAGAIEDAVVEVSSTGKAYVFKGACAMTGASTSDESAVDPSDTTDGLKNDAGVLVKR